MPASIADPNKRFQFVISRDSRGGYARLFTIADMAVHHGDGVSLTELRDESGVLIGIFLGSVIDFASNAFRPRSITLPWNSGRDDLESLESQLYERAGSWMALIAFGGVRRVYMDACGSMPVVYSKKDGLIGSSASALFSREAYFNDLHDEAKSETWFKADWYHTAGLTAHRSLARLLPNHRLTVDGLAVERIWPRKPLRAIDADQAVREVAEVSRATIEVAMPGTRVLAPLTAGNETRALLSLLRDATDRALFFTGSFPGAVIDLGAAKRLARRFGLSHVVSKVEPRAQAEAWRYRTGHCVGGAVGGSQLDRSQFPADIGVELSGAAGEVGRGFLWAAADTPSNKLSSEILLARLKLPKLDRFVAAVDGWLESVKQFDAFTVMDLAYIELKMACWAGPQATGSETDVPQIWPFSSRRCFTAMMSAPPQIRLEQSLFRRIVEREWPQLLEIPINQGTPWENARRLLYRASSPRRIWNKIRKNFAGMKSTEEIA